MTSKTTTLVAATAIIAAAGLVYVNRDTLGPHLAKLASLSEKAAPPAPPAPAGPPGGAPPPPRVPVAEVVARDIAPSAEFTGHIAATKTVELRPRVGGAIDSVSVPEGNLVREGQLLFQIDPRPYQVAVDTAQAQLRQAEVLVDQAQTDLKRTEPLLPSGTVSRKTYDDTLATLRQREAQLQAAKTAVAAAQLDISFTRVAAPIGGRVDRVLVTEGNIVAAGGANATLLTTIVSTDPLYAYFDIDEATYLEFVARARPDAGGRAMARLPVAIGLMNETGFPQTGELDFLGNQVDRSTGTIRARAIVRNPEGRLSPGLFARVKLVTSEPRQTVLIDDQAVAADQGRRFVLVLGAENKAEYRPVELGPVIDGLRVVAAGLKPGERVIIKGLVRPGMQVVPVATDMQQAGAIAQEARR